MKPETRITFINIAVIAFLVGLILGVWAGVRASDDGRNKLNCEEAVDPVQITGVN